MYTSPRITLAMFIMVFVGVVRGLWGSIFGFHRVETPTSWILPPTFRPEGVPLIPAVSLGPFADLLLSLVISCTTGGVRRSVTSERAALFGSPIVGFLMIQYPLTP